MGRRFPVDLLAAVGLTLALDAAVFVPLLRDTPLRIPLGFVFVALVPGYVVVAALFPERFRAESGERREADRSQLRGTAGADGVTVTERLLLSVGLSLVVVPAIGYAWNFTERGIQLAPVVLSLSGFTLAVAVVAAVRRWRLPADAQFRPSRVSWVDGGTATGSESLRLVNVVLAVSVLFFAASAGYAALELSHDEQYSELYLLSEDGEAFAGADESPVVVAGERETVGVAVGNHEGQRTNYTVVLVQQTVDSSGNATEVQAQTRLDQFTLTVDSNETVVRNHTFRAPAREDRSRVVWLLYTGEGPDTPSIESSANHVYLWVAANASESERRAPY